MEVWHDVQHVHEAHNKKTGWIKAIIVMSYQNEFIHFQQFHTNTNQNPITHSLSFLTKNN